MIITISYTSSEEWVSHKPSIQFYLQKDFCPWETRPTARASLETVKAFAIAYKYWTRIEVGVSRKLFY
jgi:hypothetical protein